MTFFGHGQVKMVVITVIYYANWSYLWQSLIASPVILQKIEEPQIARELFLLYWGLVWCIEG